MMDQSAKCQSVVPTGAEVFNFDVLYNDTNRTRYRCRRIELDDQMKMKKNAVTELKRKEDF